MIESHDRIHVRLNENERMGKKRVAGENVEEEGCRRTENCGKEYGKRDRYSVTQRQRREDGRKRGRGRGAE